MKIVALGDAHLGRSAGPATSNGINQRELDFDDSFSRSVDLGLAQNPDLFVWLGDVFDRPNPSYRSYRVAQRELVKIREHGVPLVCISGNHDTPRVAGTGSPYRSLEDVFTSFNFAPGFEYRSFEFPGLVVHCVPQMNSVQATLDALDEVKANRSTDRVNLLLTHPRLTQVQPKFNDLNEITVDASALDCDLVLLGHYHTHKEVVRGMWYAGATDGFDFSDEYDTPKGVVLLDTDAGQIQHVALSGRRPMVMPEPIHALGMGPDDVLERMLSAIATVPEGAVAKVIIDGVAPEVWSQVDLRQWREASEHCLWAKADPRMEHAGVTVQNMPELTGVQARFEEWMKPQEAIGLDRDALVARGKQYLADAVTDASE